MNEAEREKAFPIHIDLGSKAPELSLAVNKPAKTKKVYPMLFIHGVEDLDQLPEKGCALIEFRRKRISTNQDGDEEPKHSVELEVRAMCLQDEEDSDDFDDAVDKMARKIHGKPEKDESEEYEDDGDEE